VPHATVTKDATTDLDPPEFRNVATFATVACGTYASAAGDGLAYPNISADKEIFMKCTFQTREHLLPLWFRGRATCSASAV